MLKYKGLQILKALISLFENFSWMSSWTQEQDLLQKRDTTEMLYSETVTAERLVLNEC